MEHVQKSYPDLREVTGSVHQVIPPMPAPPSVSRPMLVQRIEEGLSGRLVLLTAPAGWGKSSVLAEWVSTTSRSVAWLGCEARDNHGLRFVRALISAIEQVMPGVGGDLFPMLRNPQPLPTASLFSVLADALMDRQADLVIVLDDFHLVTDRDVRDGVYGLISDAIPTLQFVVASRHTPPWPLARWRAYGEIVEIGIPDLAFTVEETSKLIGEGVGDGEIAALLRQRSEGWAAGIRLASLLLRGLDDPSKVPEILNGSNRDVADYLVEEVISQLPEHMQVFLESTAVLDRFSGSLARAVTGIDDADQLIDRIEREGLFVIPLDHEREWYRFHAIFREFLIARLRRRRPEHERHLFREAADWHEARGEALEAVSYLIRAGEPDSAANLMDRIAVELLLRDGEVLTLIRIVEQLPRESVARRPALQRYYAWALVLVGRLGDAEVLARQIEESLASLPDDERRVGMAEVAAIRSRIAAYRGNEADTIAHASHALENAAPDMDWFRADALLSLGFAYRGQGRLDRACEVFGEAATVGWRTGFAHSAMWGARYQALTFLSLGRLGDAERLIERDMERARRQGMDHTSAFAALLISQGELRYERNDLVAARHDLERGLTLARQVGDAKILMNVYVALAHLHAAHGDFVTARDAAHRALSVFGGEMEKSVAAGIALRQGDVTAAQAWVDSYMALAGSEPRLAQGEVEQIMLGRLMLALHRVDEAYAFLGGLLQQAETTGRWGRALVIRLLIARAAAMRGDDEAALAHTRDAIDMASRERHVRSVIDEGSEVMRLLRRAARIDDSEARRQYVASLPAITDAPVVGGRSEGSALPEPLTSRQREVLRLLVEGLSNRDIADALFVSEGTVKAHVHQIFGKLMVRSRAEAIRAARQRGIDT